MPMMRIPYFDGALIDVDDSGDADGVPLTEAEAATILSNFLALGPEDRLSDTRHLYAYYRDFRDAIGGAPWLDETMGGLETSEAIWNHVTPTSVFLRRGDGDDRQGYVVVEGECAWEGTGLMMVWRDGRTLCKVGGYDGHVTNAHAFGDESLCNVVYKGAAPRFWTYLDR